jgi:hypothetical protein
MERSDRQRLHAQMAEVVRRAGTSVERNTRWRSQTAPGTRGPDELLHLTGNSANAEVVAKHHGNRSHFKALLSDQKFESAQSFMAFLQHVKAIGLSLKIFQSAP